MHQTARQRNVGQAEQFARLIGGRKVLLGAEHLKLQPAVSDVKQELLKLKKEHKQVASEDVRGHLSALHAA
eukprot:2256027-Pleurochrysis_carterae.AAC.2